MIRFPACSSEPTSLISQVPQEPRVESSIAKIWFQFPTFHTAALLCCVTCSRGRRPTLENHFWLLTPPCPSTSQGKENKRPRRRTGSSVIRRSRRAPAFFRSRAHQLAPLAGRCRPESSRLLLQRQRLEKETQGPPPPAQPPRPPRLRTGGPGQTPDPDGTPPRRPVAGVVRGIGALRVGRDGSGFGCRRVLVHRRSLGKNPWTCMAADLPSALRP